MSGSYQGNCGENKFFKSLQMLLANVVVDQGDCHLVFYDQWASSSTSSISFLNATNCIVGIFIPKKVFKTLVHLLSLVILIALVLLVGFHCRKPYIHWIQPSTSFWLITQSFKRNPSADLKANRNRFIIFNVKLANESYSAT